MLARKSLVYLAVVAALVGISWFIVSASPVIFPLDPMTPIPPPPSDWQIIRDVIPGLAFGLPVGWEISSGVNVDNGTYYTIKNPQDKKNSPLFLIFRAALGLCRDGTITGCAEAELLDVPTDQVYKAYLAMMDSDQETFDPAGDVIIGEVDATTNTVSGKPVGKIGKKFKRKTADNTLANVKVLFYFPQGVYIVEDMRWESDDELLAAFLSTMRHEFIRI